MIILTDLTERGMVPLDWPVEAVPVKPRLTKSEREIVAGLQGLVGAVGPESLFTTAHGGRAWDGLAVADHAGGSQYDALLELARAPAGLPGRLAAVALEGRGFHGNRGRPWQARRGNLHLSCAVPVDLDAARDTAGVPAVPVVAVGDALERCAPDLPWRIKWVNDLTVDDAKLAGVISAVQSRGRRLVSLVYGLGVNVAVAPPVPPTLFVPRVTCLHDHSAGSAVTLSGFCGALLDALGGRIEQLQAEGPGPVVAAYRARCGDIGRRVRVWAEGLPDTDDPTVLPAPVASGRVIALDDDLALHVDGAAGPLVGGRLAHLDAAGEEPGR